MISYQTFITFFSASILIGLAPGPDNIFVLTQSALQGRSAGFSVMFGLCTGLIFHTLAVTFGVAVIFQQSAFAFSCLKYIGASYLIYLAWKAFRSPKEDVGSSEETKVSRWALYRRGVIMNITNPKVSIFFLAFLPQFADPGRGPVHWQMILLGGLFIVATLIVFGGIALLAETLGRFLRKSDSVQKHLNRITGTVFLGLAIKLATARK